MILINDNEKQALKDFTFIDLFAGIGGFRVALESFGAKCVFSSEIDKFAIETYFENYKEIPSGDITKIKEEDIPNHDILCAGFPCQPFSISGKQKGFEDTRGTLFFDVARIVKYHTPKILFLENVKNFETHDGGRTLNVIEETLKELGYKVHYKVLNASKFGIPQKRERIYIVAFRNDIIKKDFTFPNETLQNVSLEDFLSSNIEEIERFIINREDITIRQKDIDKALSKNIHFNSLRIGEVALGRQGERIYHPKAHAITLSADGGGIGAKTGLYYINGLIRRLSPNECRKIMGYPDSFKIVSSDSKAHKQFGNSVVIDVLQYIIKEIINSI